MDFSKEEIKREKNRLKKQKSRQEMRSRGEITDLPMKKRLIIQNICKGIKTRVDLRKYGISLDMIPCDQSIIHPDVLEQFKMISQPSQPPPQLPIYETSQGDTSTDLVNPEIQKRPKLKVKIKTMSQNQVNQIFDQAYTDKNITVASRDSYKGDFNTIIKLLKCPVDDIIPSFKDSSEAFKILHGKYHRILTYKNMIASIISLGKYSEFFRDHVDIEPYRQEMNQLRGEVSKKDEAKADQEAITPWSDYVKMRVQMGSTEPDSIRYLILCLYTMLPTIRDNYGKVYIVYDDTNIPLDEKNLYYPATGRLNVGEYKTRKFHGIIDEVIPHRLQTIIGHSLEIFPRKYLITKDNLSDVVYDANKGGKLSSILTSRFFDFSINDIRHSLETYVNQFHNKFTFAELKLIRHIMGHNAIMGDIYARRKTEDSVDYCSKVTDTKIILENIFQKIGGNE